MPDDRDFQFPDRQPEINEILGPAAVTAGLFLFFLGAVLAPFPLLRAGLLVGPRGVSAITTAALITISGLAVLVAGSPLGIATMIMAFSVVAILPALLGLRGVAAGWSLGQMVVSLTLIQTAIACLGLMMIQARAEISLTDQTREMYSEQIDEFLAQQTELGLGGEQLREMEESLAEVTETAARGWPAIIGISFMLGAVLLFSQIPRILGPAAPLFPQLSFAEYRNPWLVVWMVIVAGLAAVTSEGIFADSAWNLLVGSLGLCFLQGFSVGFAFLMRLPGGVHLKIATAILFIFVPGMILFTAVVGLFDPFFEWRRFRTVRDDESE